MKRPFFQDDKGNVTEDRLSRLDTEMLCICTKLARFDCYYGVCLVEALACKVGMLGKGVV